MEQKTKKSISEDFAERILFYADKWQNIESLKIVTKCNHAFMTTDTKRLSTVGCTDNFIEIEGVMDDNKQQCSYFIPFDNILYIEVKEKQIEV